MASNGVFEHNEYPAQGTTRIHGDERVYASSLTPPFKWDVDVLNTNRANQIGFSVALEIVVLLLGLLLGLSLVGSASATVQEGSGQQTSQRELESRLGRLQIASGPLGKTLARPDGTLLRGGAIWIYKWGLDQGLVKHNHDLAYWKTMQEHGINAVRVICFDPWQASHGATGTTQCYPAADFNQLEDLRQFFNELDFVVATAAQHDMHVIINYHNTGGYRDPDHSQPADDQRKFGYLETTNSIRQFWTLVAPRYAHRPHVAFELMNEPVQWNPEHYDDRTLDDIQQLSDFVALLAPQTHQILVSTANHISWKPQEHSLLKVAQKLQGRGVDFSNKSIGFHSYNAKYPQANESPSVLETMKEFAVINTEANFPKGSIESDDPDGSGFDGDKLITQSMERMGVSWLHWNISNPQEFEANFIQTIVVDAKKKGYFWGEQESSRLR